jgi:hypothetical protein
MWQRTGVVNGTNLAADLRTRLRRLALLAIVALLPLVNLWTIDQLDRQHRSAPEQPGNALVRSFALDGPWRTSPTRVDAALATAGPDAPGPVLRKSEAPPAQMPIIATVGPPATKTLMTPPSYWHSPEMVVAFLINAGLVGLAVALVLGVGIPLPAQGSASQGSASEVPAIARREVIASDAGDTEAYAQDNVRRLAHQVRQEVGDTVHALRTPISIIMGFSDALKRTIPQDNVKAWRAIEALDVSTGRLNSAVDRAWQRGDSLAHLFLVDRQRVDLAEVLQRKLADDSALLEQLMIEPGCEQACRVIAPPSVIDKALDDVLATLEEFASSRCTARLGCRAGEVTLSVDSHGATVEGEDVVVVDEHQLRKWPKLCDAARNARMLGGHLTVAVGQQGPTKIVLTLPAGPQVRLPRRLDQSPRDLTFSRLGRQDRPHHPAT